MDTLPNYGWAAAVVAFITAVLGVVKAVAAKRERKAVALQEAIQAARQIQQELKDEQEEYAKARAAGNSDRVAVCMQRMSDLETRLKSARSTARRLGASLYQL